LTKRNKALEKLIQIPRVQFSAICGHLLKGKRQVVRRGFLEMIALPRHQTMLVDSRFVVEYLDDRAYWPIAKRAIL